MSDLTRLSSAASSAMLARRLLPRRLLPDASRRRLSCVFDDAGARMAISASLASIVGSANVITAAAAAAANGTGAHAAVTSTIAHVAVTAVAIASGACLSTKVDFLWPREEEPPDSIILDGVDVTGYPIFNDPKVLKAIAFARKAHHGQFRKTGEPYLTHCIHTGRILAALIPPSGKRAVDTVVAGILHDVIDDTCENLNSIQEEFGDDVASLVSDVSRLSYINQLLRRHRRSNMNQNTLHPEEASSLRVMLLGMVDDPRVVLIKLADRLHNMRTIYALPVYKAQAVAQETLSVWCSLASRLGVWAVKAEMEDLCFAVLQPQVFLQMKSELASMWTSDNKSRHLRRISQKSGLGSVVHDSDRPRYKLTKEDIVPMKDLLEAVIPFDLLLDRRKRSIFLTKVGNPEFHSSQSNVLNDSRVALASLVACEEALERELFISTSYIPGMEVTISSRLKSLYSIYCKMKRKDTDIGRVYDARALRVVVGDKNGALQGEAIKCCYNLLDIIHRLWSPIDGEFDDYIVNPKPSGYQSLHTAVQGPDCSPLEVQIRTQQMHAHAEYGLAAHWIYKEAENKVGHTSSTMRNSKEMDEEYTLGSHALQKYNSLKVGHPVLRVDGSHLLAAVVISVDKGGSELLVAVSFGLGTEAVADRRSSFQMKRWEAYARLYKKVSDQWWFKPGHGDWCTYLEKYKLSRDGMYHKEDQFGRLLPTFIQIINFTEQEEAQYRKVVSAVLEGEEVASISLETETSSHRALSFDSGINNKVNLLRTMLQWEEQVHQEAVSGVLKRAKSMVLGEVVIIRWPDGHIMRMRSGSTAADAARRIGFDGKIVLVNGHLVLPNTVLKDGDIVEVRR